MLSLKEMALAIGADYQGEDLPFQGFSIDSREVEKGSCFVAFKGAKVDAHDFIQEAIDRGAGSILCSRPIRATVPVIQVSDTEKAMGQLARLWRRQFSIPVIAITGSSGKTTVKHLTGLILKKRFNTLVSDRNFNSQFSLPLILGMLKPEHEVAVLEMGARFSNDIRYLMEIAEPTIGLVTLVNPCHIGKFGTIEAIAQTKGELFECLSPEGTAILNEDDAFFESWKARLKTIHFYTFGSQKRSDFHPENVVQNEAGSVFDLVTPKGVVQIHLPLPGFHNVMNAVSAAALAMQAGALLSDVASALQEATSAHRRLQIHSLKNAMLIDDSYNASPSTMRVALGVLSKIEGSKAFFMGDMAELDENQKVADHANIGAEAKRLGVSHLYGVGQLTKNACEAFGPGAVWFESQAHLLAHLPDLLKQSSIYLVKGSRGSRMDVIADAILSAESEESKG